MSSGVSLTLQSILGAFSKPNVTRTSSIPLNPNSAPPHTSSYYAANHTPSTSTSSHFPDQQSLDFSPEYSETVSTRTGSYITGGGGTLGSRSISGSTIGPAPMSAGIGQGGMSSSASMSGSGPVGSGTGEKKVVIRRPEDVFRVTRDRLFSWSYMMQWYQG